ncbi:hypothetical protein C8J57DRAFT_1513275 [Mycena rebaudengoi]|nr:hypothetical protein C8J57DRAFT_1513275 [Mycena rebaudengoi]
MRVRAPPWAEIRAPPRCAFFAAHHYWCCEHGAYILGGRLRTCAITARAPCSCAGAIWKYVWAGAGVGGRYGRRRRRRGPWDVYGQVAGDPRILLPWGVLLSDTSGATSTGGARLQVRIRVQLVDEAASARRPSRAAHSSSMAADHAPLQHVGGPPVRDTGLNTWHTQRLLTIAWTSIAHLPSARTCVNPAACGSRTTTSSSKCYLSSPLGLDPPRRRGRFVDDALADAAAREFAQGAVVTARLVPSLVVFLPAAVSGEGWSARARRRRRGFSLCAFLPVACGHIDAVPVSTPAKRRGARALPPAAASASFDAGERIRCRGGARLRLMAGSFGLCGCCCTVRVVVIWAPAGAGADRTDVQETTVSVVCGAPTSGFDVLTPLPRALDGAFVSVMWPF